MRNYIKAFISGDWKSGLSVFLVALPLCLGIALASGAPILSGLIAGISGGIIVTLFSNSSLSVSGPAAGLTVIVYNAIQALDNYNLFLKKISFSNSYEFINNINDLIKILEDDKKSTEDSIDIVLLSDISEPNLINLSFGEILEVVQN